MTPQPDPYEVLGVSRGASQDEINSAYRRLVRSLHPDSRASDAAAPPDALERVLAAYAVLRDPARRAEYDRRHGPPAPQPPSQPAGSPRNRVTIRVTPVRYHGPNT